MTLRCTSVARRASTSANAARAAPCSWLCSRASAASTASGPMGTVCNASRTRASTRPCERLIEQTPHTYSR